MMSFLESVIDFFAGIFREIGRSFELFLGAAFAVVGVMGFESDKFCDGNTADYLSCTRPSTFYYYDAIDIALVVIGVTLLLVWISRSRRGH